MLPGIVSTFFGIGDIYVNVFVILQMRFTVVVTKTLDHPVVLLLVLCEL